MTQITNPIPFAEKIESILRTTDVARPQTLRIARVLFEHRIKGDAVAAFAVAACAVPQEPEL